MSRLGLYFAVFVVPAALLVACSGDDGVSDPAQSTDDAGPNASPPFLDRHDTGRANPNPDFGLANNTEDLGSAADTDRSRADATDGNSTPDMQNPQTTERYPAPCTISTDDDDDGTINRLEYFNNDNLLYKSEVDRDGEDGFETLWTFAHDAAGNVISEERDGELGEPQDGRPDERVTYAYNARNQLVLREMDIDADRTIDFRQRWSFDALGNLVEIITDDDADGTTDYKTVSVYEGNKKLETKVDSNGDDIFDEITRFFYEGCGDLLCRETIDFGNDGTIEVETTYSYNSKGLLIEVAVDTNMDGVSDVRNTSTYTEDEQVARETFDADGDGNPEQIKRYTYTSEGWLKTLETKYTDATTLETYSYDGYGNLLSLRVENVTSPATPTTTSLKTYDYSCKF